MTNGDDSEHVDQSRYSERAFEWIFDKSNGEDAGGDRGQGSGFRRPGELLACVKRIG